MSRPFQDTEFSDIFSESEVSTALEPRVEKLPLPQGWIDPNAAKVLRRLRHCDYVAYLVGGCVRDLMMGRYPKDFDIATDARPRDVKRIFSNCRLIGRRFRLAHIMFQDTIIEVATFRSDPKNSDDGNGADEGIAEDLEDLVFTDRPFRPVENAAEGDLLIRSDNVFGTPREDALRRDFTINGLFYDVISQELIDWTGGLRDLEARIIRTIGDPVIRFQEDPVRMLRAVKFAASLRFQIEETTWNALCQVANDIRRAASPRIYEELLRMVRGGASVRCFELLAQSGLLDAILPELAPLIKQEVSLNRTPATSPWTIATSPDSPMILARADLLDHLMAMDCLDQSVRSLPTHLALTLMCLVPLHRLLDVTSGSITEQVFRKSALLIESMGSRLKIPRRDREGARQVFVGLSRLIWLGNKSRSWNGICRKVYFQDVLLVFVLHCLATRWNPPDISILIKRGLVPASILPLVHEILESFSSEVRYPKPRTLGRRVELSSSTPPPPPDLRKPKRNRSRRKSNRRLTTEG